MKARITAVLLVSFLVCQGNLKGETSGSSPQPSSSQRSIAMRFYLSRVIVQLRDGSSLYGFLVNIEGDGLIIRKGSKEQKIAPQEITKVTLEIKKNPGLFLSTGLLTGILLGNLLVWSAESQPIAYLESDPSLREIFWSNIIFAGTGSGIGYLAGLFEKGEKSFSFSEREGDRLTEWERMRSFASGKIVPKKIHFSIQAGQVFPSVARRYEDVLENAGYDTWRGNAYYIPYDISIYAEGARDFNVLRKCQLTYSVRSWIDIGAAIQFLGEPVFSAFKEYEYGYGKSIGMKLSPSTGYFALVNFRPFASFLPKPIQWALGLGLGAAQTSLKMSLHAQEAQPPHSESWESYLIKKTAFSSLFFTELNFFLYDNLSLGIVADYVLLPPEEIPAFPAWDLPAQKIRLGNSCLGISLGFHF